MAEPRRPDSSSRYGDPTARAVNLTWALQRERMERRARQQPANTQTSADSEADRRFEAIEAALFGLFRLIDDAQSTADLAVEMAESAR